MKENQGHPQLTQNLCKYIKEKIEDGSGQNTEGG